MNETKNHIRSIPDMNSTLPVVTVFTCINVSVKQKKFVKCQDRAITPNSFDNVFFELYFKHLLRIAISRLRFQTTFLIQLFAIESEHATNNKNVRSNNMLILEIPF